MEHHREVIVVCRNQAGVAAGAEDLERVEGEAAGAEAADLAAVAARAEGLGGILDEHQRVAGGNRRRDARSDGPAGSHASGA